MSRYYDDSYLAHHGILGQKWGKLNGPPYPLDASDHTQRQKTLASKAGVKVGKSSGLGKDGGAEKLESKKLSKKEQEAKAKRKETIKKVVIGTAIGVGIAAAAYGIYKYKNTKVDHAQSAVDKIFEQAKIANEITSNSNSDHHTPTLRELLDSGKVKITDKEYISMAKSQMMIEDTDGYYRVDDVNDAFEEATKWNYLMDKYGGRTLKDVEINKGLKDLVDKYANDTSDVTIAEAGKKVYRTTFGKVGRNFDVSKLGDATYVTNNDRDRNVYDAVLRNFQDKNDDTEYEITMKAVNKLVSPGKGKRVSYFADLFKNDPEYRKELNDMTGGGLFSPDAEKQVRLGKAEGVYYNAAWALVKNGTGVQKKYMDKVKNDGYNALLDDHDIMDKLGKTPTILLNAKNDVTLYGKRVVSDAEKQLKVMKYLQTWQDDWKRDPNWSHR